MQVRVLGAIEVIDPPEVALGGPTQRRALAALVLNANRVVSVDQLIDIVWPDGETPDRAEHNLRTYMHRLRGSLGEAGTRVETAAGGYRLRLEHDELDADRFEDLVAAARTASENADFEHARELLDEALGLWDGRPYDEFADEPWAQVEATRLSELRASAIEHRFAALLEAGRHTEVVGPLQEAIATEPWREARRVQLAIALYRSGRQAEALQTIQRYKTQLADETGLVASPELERLEHQILDHDPVLLPSSHRGHMLRGYQLDKVMGEGAFSLVWSGVQPSLGRKVAIKQIRAELANEPDFVHRFETEAQTVAALEHPHIVPLYDYWREPDSAYLVMRYVGGGSLESELLDHRLDDAQLRRFVDQVGSALHTAHRVGVIHRDVKSANVLLDADGNFYLTDFGIAFTGSLADDELATSLSTGSPAYASPEQLRRQALDSRTDIYGFGITLFEAATGRLPFADARTKAALVKRQLEDPVPLPSSVSPGVPAWVDHVVARATAKDPADRFASMAELMSAVPIDRDGTVDRSRNVGGVTVIGDLVNPFKALRAFREADAPDFYGRDRLVTRFIEVLARPGSAGRLLAVVGPSGSGKSSVVRSGLLPRLRAGALPGSHRWFITTMLPGTRPFDELESALSRIAVRQPGPLVELMRDDDRGIARAINQILPDEDSELLLVIDQFEELFTHSDDDDRARFLDQLLDAVREPRTRLRVVLTVRADFWDRPLRHPGLAPKLETASVTVSPLAADELEAAIVEPVRRQGGVYEPGLVARIIADVGDQPGALPLLQYTLTELFDTHVGGLIRAESYDAIGGLSGALTRRAEDTLAAMTTDQQAAARRIFGSLVTLGEGTDDTRRRVRITELGDDPDTTKVIETFGGARLLVFDHHPATREPTVEIAHEALIQAWPRLRSWLDEDRDQLRNHRHLTDTANAWMATGRDIGELYRGGRLDTAEPLLTADEVRLNPVESEFLRASVERRDADAARDRRRVRRLHRLVTATALIATAALIAGGIALHQRRVADRRNVIAIAAQAEARQQADAASTAEANAQQQADAARAAEADAQQQARTAEARALAGQAIAMLDIDLDRALELAIEGYRAEQRPETSGALLTVLSATAGVRRSIQFGDDVVTTGLDRSGTRAAVISGGAIMQIWDLQRGAPVGSTFAVSSSAVSRIEFDAGGDRVAIGYNSGDVEVWDLSTGELLVGPWSGPRGPVHQMVFTADGEHLVSLEGKNLSGTWWDLVTGESKSLGNVLSVAAVPNDDRFITGSSGPFPSFEPDVVQWWDGLTGTKIGEPLTPAADLIDVTASDMSNAEFIWPVLDLALSDDATTVATTHMGGFTLLRDLETGTVKGPSEGFALVSPLAVSPDGTRLAGVTSDSSVRIWSTDDSYAPVALPGALGAVDHVAFTQDGSLVIVGPSGAHVVDPGVGPQMGHEFQVFDDHVVDTLFYLPDGRLAAGGIDNSFTSGGFAIWDPSDEDPVVEPFARGVLHAAVSADGHWLAIASDGPTIEIRDLHTGETRTVATPGYGPVVLGFSPDSTLLASLVWNPVTDDASVMWFSSPEFELRGTTSVRERGFSNPPTGMSFSADSAVLAVAPNRSPAVLIDVATGEVTRTLEAEAPGAYAVALDHDGSHLYVDSSRGDMVIDLTHPTTAPLVLPSPAGGVADLALSTDERTLYGIGGDGDLIIWDLESNQRVGSPVHPGSGTSPFGGGRSIALAPDGQHAAVGYGDGRVVVWDVDPEVWVQRACALVPQSEFCP